MRIHVVVIVPYLGVDVVVMQLHVIVQSVLIDGVESVEFVKLFVLLISQELFQKRHGFGQFSVDLLSSQGVYIYYNDVISDSVCKIGILLGPFLSCADDALVSLYVYVHLQLV